MNPIKFQVFINIVFRTVYAPRGILKIGNVLLCKKLRESFRLTGCVKVANSERLPWVGHVQLGKREWHIYNRFARKTRGKRPLERSW
jgi:hypothetical protein